VVGLVQGCSCNNLFSYLTSNWFASRRTTQLLGVVWASLLLLRLSVLGKGAFGSYDEGRYLRSFDAVRAAAHGDWHGCAYILSMTDARPLDALWRFVPATAQLALNHWAGWSIYTYPSLLIPTALNWVTTVVAAWVFWAICRQLLRYHVASTQWSLVAAILYAGLVNTSIDVRHVAPYDGAMLLFLALLYWVLIQSETPKAWFWAKLGIGAGALWLMYPGYYAAPALLVAPLLSWENPLAWVRTHFHHLLLLGAGFFAPLVAAEVLSRYGGGPPFWAISYDLSLHVLQGDPAEGYTFLFSYLWRVEKGLGLVLLLLLSLALAQVAQRVRHIGLVTLVPRTPLQKILLAALLLFLVHATAAAVGHRIVWYGRLLRLYMPFIVLAGVTALSTMPSPRIAAQIALGSCLISGFSYVLFLIGYTRIVYPADIISDFKLACLPYGKVFYYNEVKTADKLLYSIRSNKVATIAHCPPAPGDSITVLVNFALLYPLVATERRAPLSLGHRARIILDAPLNRSFPAYEFEGLRPSERAEAERQQFRLRIIRVAALPTTTINGLLLR
jgi:hypothetical protein